MCQEHEARNHELEHAVKRIVRRIESLEVQQVANGQVNEKQHHSPNETKKKEFRKAVRIAVARQLEAEKESIMEARSNNMEVFHKLVQKNRREGIDHILDINVSETTFSGDKVIEGFKEHFCALSTLKHVKEWAFCNPEYHSQVEMEKRNICKQVDQESIRPVIENKVRKAISTTN
ncbi:Hypothetical predicted protein [Mytilus galloprovincialis]|uniref:Uncharacterized protein n=1 Tax=Mytilus galloprovincialis TaxID=29158 RepID=A0A8B6F5C6_MYTGA|nr:Hypothetical predicted protein [Mytilus galloprovincialis]